MYMNFDPFVGMLDSLVTDNLFIKLVANHARRVTPVYEHDDRTIEIISNIDVDGHTQQLSLWVKRLQNQTSDTMLGSDYLLYCLVYGNLERRKWEKYNQTHSTFPLTPCPTDEYFNRASFYMGKKSFYIGNQENVLKVMEHLGAIRTYVERNYKELIDIGVRF